jgi:hypothetical protein
VSRLKGKRERTKSVEIVFIDVIATILDSGRQTDFDFLAWQHCFYFYIALEQNYNIWKNENISISGCATIKS